MVTIVEKFKNVSSTCAADATDGLNSMDTAIKSLKEGYTVCGRAFTVKMPVGDNSSVLQAIRAAKPGDVLVILERSESCGGKFTGKNNRSPYSFR